MVYPPRMATLEVADDDLIVIIPNDRNHPRFRTRVLVGNKPIGLLREFTLAVGSDYPARVTASFPPPELMQRGSMNLQLSLVAYQALLAPWTDGEPRVGPTLWERLDEDEST